MKSLVTNLKRAQELAARGALFVFSDSGGKDSQAQRIRVMKALPGARFLVVHATLGAYEWPGALEHARDGAARAGVPFLVARGTKTFMELVAHRHRARPDAPAFPQAGNRQCTSDLKRDPITREVRRYAAEHGIATIVSCMGIRAQESPKRKKARRWKRSRRNSVAGRDWYEWLPVHHLTTSEVFETIREAGEEPHYAYARGNARLSCIVCILSSRADTRNGAIHHPEVFAEYVEAERRTGSTVHQGKRGGARETLEQFAGITVAEAREAHRRLPVLRGVA